MKRLQGLLAAAVALIAGAAAAQIPLAGIIEARGAGAPAATSFKNGYMMAIDEINAGGGVLGQRLALTQFDIDTSPEAAAEAAQKAVATKPFAILGPQFSGITAATMKYTGEARIPQFTSGEAASLTRRFHPTLLRTSLSQSGSAPRLGALVASGLEAKRIAIAWIDNEFGRDGRAALVDYLRRRGVTLAVEVPIKPGAKDLAAEFAALTNKPLDLLLLYATENESIVALRQLRAQGFDRPIVADGLVASQKVIDGAAGGAEGVLVHMNHSVDAPIPAMQSFVKRYQARYGGRPDLNSSKGYFAVQMLKAGLEVAGKVDREAFLEALRSTRFDSRLYPELFGSVSYDFFGDLNRASFYAVIRQSRPQILASVRLIEGGMIELPGGRIIALDSDEFRRELAAALPATPAPARRNAAAGR